MHIRKRETRNYFLPPFYYFFSAFFLLFFLFTPLSFQHIHPTPQTHLSPLSCLLFPLSYCIGTISQFPSISLSKHPGFFTGIKLSVAHHFAATSGLPRFSFPHCCFHSCLLQHISPSAWQRPQGIREEQGRQGHGRAMAAPLKTGECRQGGEHTARSLHSPEGQLTLDSGHGCSSALFR